MASAVILFIRIRDRLRFLRTLIKTIGEKLYAKAAFMIFHRLVTYRLPIVRDLVPFYYAKKNFWKFAFLYLMKKAAVHPNKN
nr:hypothetical protein TDPV-007 [Oriental turtle dovepox virus]WIK87672.1 hypothetical protein TDPV-374 [Oriental turtle dovepox virus]